MHVGGSGTYYPVDVNDANDALMPKICTGYSMGPFLPAVNQVQKSIEDDMKCNIPGFEGVFFDANDVEGYLRARGLDVPPAADYATGEMDLDSLTVTSPGGRSDTASSVLSPPTPRSPSCDVVIDREIIQSNDFNEMPRFAKTTPHPVIDLSTPFGYTWNTEPVRKLSESIDTIFDPTSDSSSRPSPESPFNGRGHGEKRTVTINVEILLDGM